MPESDFVGGRLFASEQAEEAAEAMQERVREFFAKADADGDGTLNVEEVVQASL